MSRLSSDSRLSLLRNAVCLEDLGLQASAQYRKADDADSVLQAAGTLLAKVRRREVSVCLGFPWSRHVVVPWHEQLITEAQWDTWARATCDEQYVEHKNCSIAMTPLRYGKPRLAIVVDAQLVAALAGRCTAAGHRLKSVTSTFAHLLHARRDEIPGTDSAVALIERGMLTCALRKDGAVIAIASLAVNRNLAAKLRTLVNSLALSTAVPPPASVALAGDTAVRNSNIHWLGAHLPWTDVEKMP